jgi:hypothetical protein
MMRRGVPLGAVAAALASPETAERIAVFEVATTGQMSALDAARLNVQRAGHDLSLLDGLRNVGMVGQSLLSGMLSSQLDGDTESEEVAANGATPLALPSLRRHR